MEVSIIIVNYKNPPLIVQCVKSILQFEKTVEYEIIVVDNDSQDDTEQQLRAIYPNLKWIQMGYNSGFAKANNAGLRIAEGKYILYLNSDTIFIESIFQNLINEFEKDSSIGLIGCRLLNKDLSIQASYHNSLDFFRRILRRNPFMIKFFNVSATSSKNINNVKNSLCESHYADWLSGAMMLLKKVDVESLGFKWDEDFFMYWEDVELCYRIREKRKKVFYCKSSEIIHLGGASSNEMIKYSKYAMSEESKLLFIKKRRGTIVKNLYVFLLQLELRLEIFLEKRKYGYIKSESLKNDSIFYKVK